MERLINVSDGFAISGNFQIEWIFSPSKDILNFKQELTGKILWPLL